MLLRDIKTATITEKGQIVLPKVIRDAEGFKVGSKVAVLAYPDHIELRPIEQISEKMFTALASEKALAKEWLSKEDEEAWKDL